MYWLLPFRNIIVRREGLSGLGKKILRLGFSEMESPEPQQLMLFPEDELISGYFFTFVYESFSDTIMLETGLLDGVRTTVLF